MKNIRTKHVCTTSRLTAGLACTIGLALSSTAYAQQFNLRDATEDVNQKFNFIEAWGTMPYEGESAMALINNDSNCPMAENGLSCTEFRVGLSLYNDGDFGPAFEEYAVLSDVHSRDLPIELSYSEHDLADLGMALPNGPLMGSVYFQEGLIAGTLTTPTGYEMAVTGAVILNLVHVTTPEELIVDSVFFVPTRQWFDLDAAKNAVDTQADAIWNFQSDTQHAEHDGPTDVRVEIIAELDDCWRTYLIATKRCMKNYNTRLIDIANVLETCLDNVNFWDVLEGGAVGAGTGGVAGAGGTAAWTWWTGPFSAGATALGGTIGGLIGGIGGAIYGPSEARQECRDTAKNDREDAENQYDDCMEDAWNELINCILGG